MRWISHIPFKWLSTGSRQSFILYLGAMPLRFITLCFAYFCFGFFVAIMKEKHLVQNCSGGWKMELPRQYGAQKHYRKSGIRLNKQLTDQ
jgi:hypothetical protein